jgi:hypothetical protein
MSTRVVAGLCCLLGGATWAARWLLDPSGSTTGLLRYAGLAMLALGLAVAGGALGNRGRWWLRTIAGVGSAALVWSVVDVVRPAGEALAFDGALAVASGRERAPRRGAGAHAR